MKNNQNLFFSPEEKGRAFSDVLKEVQEYISSKYSTLMVEGGSEEVKQQVKRYIGKYLLDYLVDNSLVTYREIASLVLGHLNPSQVGTSVASKKTFQSHYPKGKCWEAVR